MMTTAPTGDNRMNLNERAYDDLTVINDIGPARQQWLRKSFGVRTYEDLAALSAGEVESRLRAEGQIASRSKIEEWIAKAQELATAVEPLSQRPTDSTDLEVDEEAIPLADPGAWGSLAAFVVEIQVREVQGQEKEQLIEVTHIPVSEDGTWLENDRHKDIVEGEQLYEWMLAHLGKGVERSPEPEVTLAVEVQPSTPPVPPSPVKVPLARVRFIQIQVFQPPQTETPLISSEAHQPWLSILQSRKPFRLEALLELSGPAAAELAKQQIAYYARFHAHDLATGAVTHLGDTEPGTLNGSRHSFSAGLSEATLLPGTYRLEILAMVESEPPVLGYLKVPLLQVI
jgi:hypothetical protein